MKSGKDLLAWRQQHGLSRREVGVLLNVDWQSVMRWEKRAELPRLVRLALLALAAGIELD